jgi:hypothetical protein
MPLDPVVNFFRSQIATLPLASGGATMVITTGDGNKLPNPATDGAFNLVIYNANDPFVTPEIVRVTAKSGDSLTITRAQEGTTATNKTAGNTWFVELVNTAKMIQNIDTNKVEKTGDTMTGTLTATKLIPSGNVTAGNGMYLPAANTVAFSTNGTERVRVDSSGNVGIGTTSPSTLGKLAVSSASGTTFIAVASGANQLYLGYDNVAGIASPAIESSGNLVFCTGSLFSQRMRITSTGDVGIGTTTPASALHVNGLTRSTSGINFNASGGSTLSSYEEGTFDLGIAFGGASVDVTYSLRGAKYTRTGRQVTITGYIVLTNKGTSTGVVTITGLPFTIPNVQSNNSGISIGFLRNISFADFPHGWGLINTTTIRLRQTTNAGSQSDLTDANFANNSEIMLSLTYFTS